MSLLVLIWMFFLNGNIALSAQTAPPDTITKSVQPNPILYVFTGSDWCVQCRRFEKNVLSDSVFIHSMERYNIEIEIIDFPQRKKLAPEIVKHNESIAEVYNFQGIFPTLVLSQTENNYENLLYKNEKAAEFSTRVLDKLKVLNE